MNAQLFYDIREVTGCISGQDLHDFFSFACGDPAPSGRELISLAEAAAAPHGERLLRYAAMPLSLVAETIRDYTTSG